MLAMNKQTPRDSGAGLRSSGRPAVLGGWLFLLIFLGGALSSALAFKIDTHVWVAQQILNDLETDGMLTVGGERYRVRPDYLRALLDNSDAYRLGSIGPDGFPDLVGAQMTTHPGLGEISGGWVTDDWLRWVMDKAERPEEVAFSLGYLTHAASDVFAHTYVNTYAGDIFSFQDEQEVELRHMALENFILEHQPPLLDFTQTQIYDAYYVNLSDELAEWLADTLILNPAVAHQYDLVGGGVTVHLKKMYDFWHRLDGMISEAREAQAELQAGLDSLKKRIASLKKKKVKISLGWFGSIKVKLWPWYCFIDPGTCAFIAATYAHVDLTKSLLNLTTDLGLKPLIDWRNQIRAAAVAYCRASRDVVAEILRDKDDYERPPYPPERDPTGPLKDWVFCWGPAFAGLPTEATTPVCAAKQDLQGLLALKDRYRSWELDLTEKLGRFEWIVAPHNRIFRIRTNLNELLQAEFARIGKDIAGEESILFDMIELRDEADLAEIFRADSSNKHLLVLPDIKERVMADMCIASEDEFWDPTKFPVVEYAITLSKLLLLDAAELNRMALNAGVNCSIYGDTPFVSSPDFNLLFGWIRSIDGNQQWQPYALPYARQKILANDSGIDGRGPRQRHYGYYKGEPGYSEITQFASQPGFPFWQDQGLHDRLFLKLFDRPLLSRDVLPDNLPEYANAENPFPKSSDPITGNRIHQVEDCINTYILRSANLVDLVCRFPEPPHCIPNPATASNIRYRWKLIGDVVEKRYTSATLEEFRDFDRTLNRTWSWTNQLFGVPMHFDGSLDELADQQASSSLSSYESRDYDEASGQLIVSFHVRKALPGFNVAASEGDFYPPNNLVDLASTFMICDDQAASPVFLKGRKGEVLLQVTVSWEDEFFGPLSCLEQYRIIEFRSPSLDPVDSYRDLSSLGTPCDIPANTMEPASQVDLTLMRFGRDDAAPVLSGIRDRQFDFAQNAGSMDYLSPPRVADDWFRADELNLDDDAPDRFPLGTTTVHWTAADPNGNVSSVSQKITIVDREPPQFLPNFARVAGSRLAWESQITGAGAIVPARPGGGGAGPGEAGDGSDTQPEFDAESQFYDLGIVELLQENGGYATDSRLVSPRAVDNYPGEVTVFLENPEASYPLGDTVVTWVARDASGNETRADQLIRVTSLTGDVDLDDDVDDDDRAVIVSGLGERALGYGEVALEDFNEDGRIDAEDEALRTEIQAQIDSVTVDLRDLDADHRITELDLVRLEELVTPHASFSLDTDFSLLPPPTALLGGATVDQERLILSSEETASLRVTPAGQGRKVTALEASFTFQYYLGTRPPPIREGLSFNFAPDLPDQAFGATGAGSGLTITMNLGLLVRGEPRTMKVWFHGELLGVSDHLDFLTGGSPRQFVLQISPAGLLSIWLNDETQHLVFDQLPGYEPLVGQFGLGAQFTTSSGGWLWVDDFHIQATYEPPYITPRLSHQLDGNGNLRLMLRGSPESSYQIDSSEDLRTWRLWGEVIVPADQTEIDLNPIPIAEHRAAFYRARGQ